MKNNFFYALLIVIFLIGLLLRVIYINHYPVSFTMDELAIAYNSYSVALTGKDEFGDFLPLAFRSVGDYKPPLLIYMMVPIVYLFGLSEISTRLLVAIVGFLTIPLCYLLIKELSSNRYIALISSISIAISPWHIKFSRSTFEAVIALFFVLLGIYFFVKFVKSNSNFLWLSSICFSLSLYAYHSQRVFTPLLVLALLLIFAKEIYKRKKQFITFIVVGLVISLPLVFVLISPQGRVRAEMTFLTRDFEFTQKLSRLEYRNLDSLTGYGVSLLDFWSERYLDYFDLGFLFIDGMGYTHSQSPDIGLLYLFELPFFLYGLFILFFKSGYLDKNYKKLIIVWIILGPIAASFANNSQHPLRSLTLIPTYQMLVGIGVYNIFLRFRRSYLKWLFIISYLIFVGFGVIYFVRLYFVYYPLHYSEYIMQGWKESAIFAISRQKEYDEIVIDPRFGTQGPELVNAPYLYVLFYGKVNPGEYQNDIRRKEAGDSSNFRNITFREIDWTIDQGEKNKLYIGSPWVLPVKDENILKKFYLTNGKEILRAVSIK